MESSDYHESVWSRQDNFKEARRHFDDTAGRSYDEAKRTGKKNADLLPRSIKSTARHLLAILGDVTGSMGDAPGVYFSKCPYVLHEVSTEYFGKDTELIFGAIGDGTPPEADEYPFQFRPNFPATIEAATAKKKILELITTEQGGGGQQTENYELAALYLARNVSSPKATKRVCIIIGDEMPYDIVDRELARDIAFVNLKREMTAEEVFEELKADWDVYFIQRPYGRRCGEKMDFDTAKISARWVELLGADHVAYLPDIDRVVDVIFGILGDATDKYDYFMEEITQRQKPDKGGQEKIDATYRALGEIHRKHQKKTANKEKGGTTLHEPLSGKRTKSLL